MKTAQHSIPRTLLLASLCIIALAGCPSVLSGWVRLHGGTNTDYGRDLKQTTDGGYIVAGTTYSFGTFNGDMCLFKTNANGYLTWSYTFGGFDFEKGYRVVQANDGGYVVAGTTTSFGAGGLDACLVKVDSSGSYLWHATYGTADEDTALGLAKTSDGGYILTGTTINSQNGTLDIYLVKTDANGAEDWSRNIDYDGEEEGVGVVQTSDGGYAVAGGRIVLDLAGDVDSAGFFATMILVKTDGDGNPKWIQEYGEYAIGVDVCLTGDGGYVVAGAAEGWSIDPLEDDDGYAVKTDADGAEVWSLVYDSPAEVCWLMSVKAVSDGGYIFAGDQGDAALLLKTDEDGVQEWSRRFGRGRTTRSGGAAVVESSYGGYCLVGSQFNSTTDDWSVFMVKTDALGNTGLPLPVL